MAYVSTYTPQGAVPGTSAFLALGIVAIVAFWAVWPRKTSVTTKKNRWLSNKTATRRACELKRELRKAAEPVKQIEC